MRSAAPRNATPPTRARALDVHVSEAFEAGGPQPLAVLGCGGLLADGSVAFRARIAPA